jgi:phage tail sheath gpL-like
MQLLTARLKENPKTVETKYGARMVADAVTAEGETLAIWRPDQDATLGALRSGAVVTLAKDSKGKISLIDSPTEATPAAPETLNPDKPAPTMTGAQKREIASFVEEMGALYGFCYQTAAAKLPQDAPDAVSQACASSLFISAQRRFNLA